MTSPDISYAAPRGFEELRRVLIELVDDGSALGLTAAELFLQFCDRSSSDGIGPTELRKGLAALSIHFTETEAEAVLVGAGCIEVDNVSAKDGRLLTLEKFSAMIHDRNAAPQHSTNSTPVRPGIAQRYPSRAEPGPAKNHDDGNDSGNIGATEDDEDCAAPDSLTPIMSLSELLVDVQEVGGGGGGGGGDGAGPGTSSSAAAHVESFGRVAADVQAVLATAISRSGTGHTGGGGGGGVGSESFGGGRECVGGGHGGRTRRSKKDRDHRSSLDGSTESSRTPPPPISNQSSVSVTRDPGDGGGGRVGLGRRTGDTHLEQAEGTTLTSSRVSTATPRSGPVPRTGAITPPLGPARSPSEPHHPTRASRERLEAALEGLDLKERLRPTAVAVGSGGSGGGGDYKYDGDGGNLSADTPGEPGGRLHRSAGARLPSEVGSGPDAAVPSRRSASVGTGGGHAGDKRWISAIRSRTVVAGIDGRGARVSRFSGRTSGSAGQERRERQLGEVVNLAEADRRDLAAYEGGSEEAPEVIGRLRARVAELELSEQLLRCELEGARADLVSRGRRAEEEVQREADRHKERERALQAKMGARVRAAETEAAAARKRMADFKRASMAEAAAREKTASEYLRRRLREAETVLEAKATRRALLSRQQQQQQQSGRADPTERRRQGWRRDGSREDQISARNSEAAAAAKLGEELASCRKRLAAVTAEASRLRRAAAAVAGKEKNVAGRDGRAGKAERQGGKDGGGRRAVRHGKACVVCGGDRGRSSRERRRERERRLEARVAQSEDARIAAEAEAGRLQAFLEEMRGFEPLLVQPSWRSGGWDRAVAE